MPYNPKYNKKSQEYNSATYDRIAIRLKKGRRDEMKQVAEAAGMSLAHLVDVSVAEYAEAHGIEKSEKSENGDSQDEK